MLGRDQEGCYNSSLFQSTVEYEIYEKVGKSFSQHEFQNFKLLMQKSSQQYADFQVLIFLRTCQKIKRLLNISCQFSVLLSILIIIFGGLGLCGNMFSIAVLSRWTYLNLMSIYQEEICFIVLFSRKDMRNCFNHILIAINICDRYRKKERLINKSFIFAFHEHFHFSVCI